MLIMATILNFYLNSILSPLSEQGSGSSPGDAPWRVPRSAESTSFLILKRRSPGLRKDYDTEILENILMNKRHQRVRQICYRIVQE